MPPTADEPPGTSISAAPERPGSAEASIEPPSETAGSAEAGIEPSAASAPDESVLWELFHAGRYVEILASIAALRKQYPSWQPPEELLALVDEKMVETAITRAVREGDHRRLVEIARRHRQWFSCTHVDWAWSLAEAYAALDRSEELFVLLTELIAHCTERDRLSTLQKAIAWLAPADWQHLAELEAGHERTPSGDRIFRRTRYEYARKAMLAANADGDTEAFLRQLDRLAPAVDLYQDADIALLAGWTYLETRNTSSAAHWFDKARTWRPTDVDALRGLAYCALAGQRYADARDLAEQLPDASEDKREIARNATIGLAQMNYQQGNYRATLQLLDDAGDPQELPRYARLMAAWSQLHSHHASKALQLFQDLHREHPDEETAQGIFSSLIQARKTADLESASGDTFLAPLLLKYRADKYFAQKRFLSAAALAPERYGSAGSAGAPRAAWYVTLRDKSGSAGLSELRDSVHSLEVVFAGSDRSEMSLRLDHHHLDSGRFADEPRLSIAQGLLTGVLGIREQTPAFADLAETGADLLRIEGAGATVSAWEPHLSWHGEFRLDVTADIGLSVFGGVLDPRLIGHLKLSDSNEWLSYSVTGYARPIRESVLSYTGWQLDRFLPQTRFTGDRWGGVRATGAEASAYVPVGLGNAVNAKIGIEQIDGENVRENLHAFALAAINHGMTTAQFDYIAAGISAGYDHYEHNLSHFTPGHGGYFSPQTFWQFKANLDFLTLENRKAMLKGHVDAGRVFKREAASPIIPLTGFSNLGSYPGNREWGWAYSLELDASVQVGRQVQFGAHLTRRESPRYDETAGMLFIRLLFEPRQSVLSTDLPEGIMNEVR